MTGGGRGRCPLLRLQGGGRQESIRGSDVNPREEHSPRKMGISGKQRGEWPRVIVRLLLGGGGREGAKSDGKTMPPGLP